MGKIAIATAVVLAGGLLGLPVVAGGGGAAPAACDGRGGVAAILATIRTVESAGRYDAPPNAGGASGAYQHVASTWQAWARRAGIDPVRYPAAHLAPATVQDAVATAQVEAILARSGQVAAVPLAWYWPAALGDPAQLDVVPRPDAGNRLTPRQYQARWLEAYGSVAEEGCVRAGPGYALPVERRLIDADPAMLGRPHHDYPAVDLPVPTGTPVYAVAGGQVTAVTTWAGNCDTASCPEPCGIGLVVQDGEARWTYCHGEELRVAPGSQVTAGQLLMLSGNSGRSTGPHLHLGLSAGGIRRCPQPLLAAVFGLGAAPPPATLPTAGCVS